MQQLKSFTTEQCLTLHDVSWDHMEMLAPTLEQHGVHLTYLDGVLDLVTPSPEHEEDKRTLGLLLETYLRFKGMRFYARGGPTLGSRQSKVRGEPDESYNLETRKDTPDLAIEVFITSGGVDKLEKYRRWGVTEVWFWQRQELTIYSLRAEGYEQIAKSILLPDLNVASLASCAQMEDQYDAIITFEQDLRSST